jgi:cytochrome c
MKKVIAMTAGLLIVASGNVMADEALAKKSGCFACHAIGKKIVGPDWKDVAARYKGDAAARDALIKKVKTGGKGNWTEVTKGVPMPPYSPRVKDEDIAKLVDFILAL